MAGDAKKTEEPPQPKDSILLRHKRDSYYLALTAFVCVYLFPLSEAIAAFDAGPTSGAAEYGVRHGKWIATIVLRNLALCTIIYGGYHSIMYEGALRLRSFLPPELPLRANRQLVCPVFSRVILTAVLADVGGAGLGRIAIDATPGSKYARPSASPPSCAAPICQPPTAASSG